MIFGHRNFLSLLNICLTLTLGGLFIACLDIPSDPDTSGRIVNIKVHTVQYDMEDSTTLKINPMDSSALVAVVYPDNKKDDLHFFWYYGENLLGHGQVYPIKAKQDNPLPDRLVVTDKEDNSQSIKFNITKNSAPHLDDTTIPFDGEYIDADENTLVQFQWSSTDPNNDRLTHILEIDDQQYNVGSLTKIFQSGFSSGEHAFRVIVTDSFGDADTLQWIHFNIIDPNAGVKP